MSKTLSQEATVRAIRDDLVDTLKKSSTESAALLRITRDALHHLNGALMCLETRALLTGEDEDSAIKKTK